MEKKYIRIDSANIALVATQETRQILNLEGLEDQKAMLIKEHNKKLAEIQEALDKFTELE